jgi:hypothetical protein
MEAAGFAGGFEGMVGRGGKHRHAPSKTAGGADVGRRNCESETTQCQRRWRSRRKDVGGIEDFDGAWVRKDRSLQPVRRPHRLTAVAAGAIRKELDLESQSN